MKWMIWLCCCLFQCASAQEPGRYELVIHEVFADPTPSRGLPASEYIEIRNRGKREISLGKIAINNGNTLGRITSTGTLKPDSLLILCPSAYLLTFQSFGTAATLSPWPVLNNDGDTLVLLSPSGNVIHAVHWDKEWYGNDIKEEGGWSIEMMDAGLPCMGKDNWSACKDPSGGSPGRTNSNATTIKDTVSPKLLYTYMPDSVTMTMVFSETLDASSLPVSVRANDELRPVTFSHQPPLFNSITINLSGIAKEEKIYTMDSIIVADCVNNNSPPQLARFGRFSAIKPLDVIINELLFNPVPGGFDYLEVFNGSAKVIDASTLYVANRNSGGRISAVQKVFSNPFPLLPGEFLAITENPAWLMKQYPGKEFACASVPSMPSYPDDRGTVVLVNDNAVITDELVYDENWHFSFIANREGVSLERISPAATTQDAHNWHSASTSSGYGTPGMMNSQSFPAGAAAGPVTLSSPLISPDMDGRDDFILIQYDFPEPGYVANITIFDSNGLPVNRLVKNALCGIKGHFRWNGDGENNNALRKGHYIILTDVFHLGGKTKRFKNVVGLVI
jgi:hypothetical protein